MSDPYVPQRNVQGIVRISLPVSDLAAATDFYENALGFVALRHEPRPNADAIVLRLGEQVIELVRVEPPGAAYPSTRLASDPWFQHFAIAVSDMPEAFARLCAHGGAAAISQGGPQHLPPSTGSVTAYKFRDPDGHPLELSFFPPGVGAAAWQAHDRLFLGIDHTGIVVADLTASVAFYRDVLGGRVAPGLVNTGPTQARLDGLRDPVVDIVAIFFSDGPHIELLHYRGPKAAPLRLQPGDIAATELVLQAADLGDAVAGRGVLSLRPAASSASPDPTKVASVLTCDPDGHLLRIEPALAVDAET